MNYYITRECELTEEELMHYGVPGMKWGVRKASAERQAYKTARKAYRKERKALNRQSWTAFGIKGIDKYNKQLYKTQKAEFNKIDAKAKLNASKKKDSAKAAKAEMNTYVREMGRTGLKGSYNDKVSGGRATSIYDNLKVTKGKKYADKVQKKVQNKLVATIATGAAVSIGSAVVSAYLESRY